MPRVDELASVTKTLFVLLAHEHSVVVSILTLNRLSHTAETVDLDSSYSCQSHP